MKYKLSEINTSRDNKIPVPDIIHFVWVGDTNQANIEYVDIWKRTNKDKKIYFWCDKNSSLSNSLHDSIRDYVLCNEFENKKNAEICIKNHAFNYIFPKLKLGFFLMN
ncbi:TcdA/TcdB catalytic glycosyltransferase domain-containing protein [Serratia plymuthica]|uniref:TcdA/TcdB catalytic glycosyltransferase domain-containing protein n=1 Tax=Serratia plymuthica TaxID=82996 RepID=UPI003BA117E8